MNQWVKLLLELIWLSHWCLISFSMITSERPGYVFGGKAHNVLVWPIVILAWLTTSIFALAFWHPTILGVFPIHNHKLIYLFSLPSFPYQVYHYHSVGKNNKIITDHPRLTAEENKFKRHLVVCWTIFGLVPTYILAGFAAFQN
jgi:hypothetical protein